MKWQDLSLSQKSKLMELYLKNGITSLSAMKEHYNSFATGGQMNTDGHLFGPGGPVKPWERSIVVPGTTPETSDNSVNYSPQAEDTTFKQAVRRQAEVNAKVQGRKSPNQQDFNIAYGQLTRQEDKPIEQNFNPITGERQYTKEEQDLMRAQGAGLLTEGLFWALDPVGMTGYTVANNSPRLFDWNSNETFTTRLENSGMNPAIAPFVVGGLGSGLSHGTLSGIKALKNVKYTDVLGFPNSFKSTLSFDPSIFEKFAYSEYIKGNDVRGLFTQPETQIGLDNDALQLLKDRTLARNIRAIKDELGQSQFAQYKIKKLNNVFENDLTQVKVGRYSGKDYERAGQGHNGGFYDENNNFISINKDSGFPLKKIQTHEGRHLVDAKTSLTANQETILGDAFDNDFIEIPDTDYAPEWLKGYPHMRKERVTTNKDARDKLLDEILKDKKEALEKKLGRKLYIEEEDNIIENATDEEIFEAIKQANGYGEAYIKRLKAENKLTSKKASQHKKSMQRVGAVAAPLVGAQILKSESNR